MLIGEATLYDLPGMNRSPLITKIHASTPPFIDKELEGPELSVYYTDYYELYRLLKL